VTAAAPPIYSQQIAKHCLDSVINAACGMTLDAVRILFWQTMIGGCRISQSYSPA
jgi:hypothetical protein